MIIALIIVICVLVILVVGLSTTVTRQHRGAVITGPADQRPGDPDTTAFREEIERLKRDHAVEIQQLKDEAKAEFVRYAAETELAVAEGKRADRKASNARSRKALIAKIGEHLAPLLEGFPYNFKDVRHVGEIFDFLVFDGLEEGEIANIVFLEVKTSRSGRVTNPREQMLRDAIENGRIRYEVFVPKIPTIPNEEPVDAESDA